MSARGCHKDASVEGKFSSIVGVVSVGVGSGPKPGYENCGAAECVWADAHGAPRSKTKTLSKRPTAGRPTRESDPLS